MFQFELRDGLILFYPEFGSTGHNLGIVSERQSYLLSR